MTDRYQKVTIVGGCGHVGLPLGLSLAGLGRHVTLLDINQKAIAQVNRGQMPFLERGGEQLLGQTLAKKLLVATSSTDSVAKSDAIVVVTGTPVDEHLNPNPTALNRMILELRPLFRSGQLLLLRSTVYPGTTTLIAEQLEGLGLQVAFCPERIAQGFALEEIARLPQLVGGVTPAATEAARAFFTGLTDKIIELSPIEAELAKLFTNTWRYLNFAVSNQFFTLANDFGLDFYRIYQAMVQDYPRMTGFARPGFAAGPCLFKDTMQLAAFSHNSFFLGHAAMLVNEGLPNYLVGCLRREQDLKKTTVGILGMAFKADNDDSRESLSYKLRKVLSWEAKQVLCSDVYISDPSFVSAEELVRRSDVVILGAPHREYKNLDLAGKKPIDVWNFWGRGGQV